MATISSPGIGSGLDVSSIITQLMAIERQPLKQLETAETKIQSQISEVGKIKSALSKFRDVAAKLASTDFWRTTTGKSNSSAVGVTTSSTASPASFAVEVTSLAKAQTIAAPALASSSTTLGSGTLTIQRTGGGDPFDVAIEATDTLAGIRDKINAAGAGVTASILTDASGARLVMRANATGTDNAFNTTVSGTGLDGLSFNAATQTGGATPAQPAANLVATVNNLPVSSASNTLTDVFDGVTLTMTAETAGPVTIDVAADTETLKKTLTEFATAYTELSKLIVTDTKYDATAKKAGALQGDSAIVGLQNRLRSMLGASSGASTAYARLSDVGFEMQQDGSLTVNSTKLDKAIANLSELKALFSNSSLTDANLDGFGKRFRVVASDILGIDGALTSRTTGLNDKLKRNQTSQDRMEERLAQTQKRLEKQYSMLDAKLGTLNGLSTYVTNQVAQWNKA
ncbi:MAG TPA: flagellar filament capping protein FliD [Piscinibacter sp.]|jgi:flagellar hook-associated protein 2|uniref:flagellar filament capping protein FliD n=1 Tax=Piscinibacter sp. TaxID=1903157 RepID=UPI001B746177|nr:flagellar filament capping protein FliD [Piscinibacter sp.]MBK7532752.1 flagellar filament capping protein FliD [Piscinibacter sp.]MBP6543525.1 flagellar filament capping protein FliD [Piscinibacter sp.]HNW63542.1 flagellar filament capping protein FliD [Piscinibacter sp.]HOY36155.1 flagellar filament capping protein FliD [Piscinibacter sp.]HPG77663.1 flagellar filament capping protein FliD [Piscinibacter sp.]